MAKERAHRRLAAIIAADVVGYSKLMGQDEEGTLARLRILRSEFLHPKVTEYSGRIVKTTGDGALIEFGSAVDAVSHAIDVQRGLSERNAELPEGEQIRIRIGINVGDIIIEDDDDIYGDGVNVAARIEPMADPGGICISRNVYNQIKNKISIGFIEMGPQKVKNIEEPIVTYKINLDSGSKELPATKLERSLTLPDKPSIAVLPFDNLSGDPGQEFFSDGITDDIIIALSHTRWFHVISRSSTFSYKGHTLDVRQIAEELGCGYVLEGSVRRADNRVRISTQLIDGLTGKNIWASRYAREVEDVFELQDQLTEAVATAIQPEITKEELRRASRKRTDNLNAWELCQRGWWHRYRQSKADLAQAENFFVRAIKLDDKNSLAYSGYADVLFYQSYFGFVETTSEYREKALKAARNAVELDEEDPSAYVVLGRVLTECGQTEEAIRLCEKAIELDPYSTMAHYQIGVCLTKAGRENDAIPWLENMLKMSPRDIYIGPANGRLSSAYLNLKDYDKAKKYAREALQYSNIQWIVNASLVSVLGHDGTDEEIQIELKELLRRQPNLSISYIKEHGGPLISEAALEHYLDGLRKAGLPEE